MQTRQTKENLLKQMVDDSKDQHGVSIPELEEQWPEKLWSMVEQTK